MIVPPVAVRLASGVVPPTAPAIMIAPVPEVRVSPKAPGATAGEIGAPSIVPGVWNTMFWLPAEVSTSTGPVSTVAPFSVNVPLTVVL